MKKLIIICLALALLLCACGTPAGPGTDLSDFVTAFDLTDLSQYLTADQLGALDAALRENLSMARGIDNYALYYADPPEGSVKLPFDNAGGLDLARLDIEKLAEHIAGQVAAELGARGVEAATAAAVVTISTTKGTTTTSNSTKAPPEAPTSTPKPTTKKAETWVPPSQITVAELNAMSEAVTSPNTDLTFAEKPKRISVSNHEGNWEIIRARCTPETYYDGATFHIFLDKERDGSCVYVGSVHNQHFGENDLKSNCTGFVLSRGNLEIRTRGSVKSVVVDARASIRSLNSSSTPGADLNPGESFISFGVLELGDYYIYKLNSSGTGFYELKASDIE